MGYVTFSVLFVHTMDLSHKTLAINSPLQVCVSQNSQDVSILPTYYQAQLFYAAAEVQVFPKNLQLT